MKNEYENYLTNHPSLKSGVVTSKSIWYEEMLMLGGVKDKTISVLEIGPGLGEGLSLLASKGFTDLTAIDLSNEVIDHVSLIPSVTALVVTDTTQFLKDNSEKFDVIIMYHVLEHIPRSEIIITLNGIYQALKKSGKVLITVPNISSPIIGVEQQYYDFTHQTAFSPWSLAQAFSMSHFEKCNVKQFLPPKKGILRRLQRLLQQVLLFAAKYYLSIFSRIERKVLTHSMLAIGIKECD